MTKPNLNLHRELGKTWVPAIITPCEVCGEGKRQHEFLYRGIQSKTCRDCKVEGRTQRGSAQGLQ